MSFFNSVSKKLITPNSWKYISQSWCYLPFKYYLITSAPTVDSHLGETFLTLFKGMVLAEGSPLTSLGRQLTAASAFRCMVTSLLSPRTMGGSLLYIYITTEPSLEIFQRQRNLFQRLWKLSQPPQTKSCQKPPTGSSRGKKKRERKKFCLYRVSASYLLRK